MPETVITLGDTTKDNGPFVNLSDLIFVGVGKIVEEWDDRSGGQTSLDYQEGIAGASTGMAFAGRQTASLYTSALSVAGNIHPLAAVNNPQKNQTLEQKLQQKNKTQGPVTPVNHRTLNILLEGYDRDKSDMLERGFRYGFKLGYNGQRKFHTSPNLQSASQFPNIVDQKLAKEIAQNRIAGPFRESPYPNLQISPIGVIPKKEEGQFRLIHHLSYPFGSSINDFIPEEIKQVHYASIDDAISIILALGPKCALAKTDVSNAFRIIPIHPDDHELLGIKWKGNFYFDRCLPMGCSSSCAIFEMFSSALQWMAQTKCNIKHMVHVLDDFLIITPSDFALCNQSLKMFIQLCNTLGVPIKDEKTEYANTTMTFLGIELDTIAMEARLPSDKIKKIFASLESFRARKRVTLRELQSLIGLLNFACCVVLPGRTFLRRLIDLTRGVTQPHHHIKLSKESRLDIQAWFQFIQHFNGKNLFLKQIWYTSTKMHLYTDAAGSIGFGAIMNTKWFYGEWPVAMKEYNITFKELFPIVLAVEIWGSSFKNRCVLFHSDNYAVVHIINKQTSKDTLIMKLVRRLVVASMKFNILMKAEHIPGHFNILADLLSRFQIQQFRARAPYMNREPTLVDITQLGVC